MSCIQKFSSWQKHQFQPGPLCYWNAGSVKCSEEAEVLQSLQARLRTKAYRKWKNRRYIPYMRSQHLRIPIWGKLSATLENCIIRIEAEVQGVPEIRSVSILSTLFFFCQFPPYIIWTTWVFHTDLHYAYDSLFIQVFHTFSRNELIDIKYKLLHTLILGNFHTEES